ncbi:hypothetical protein H696_02674 [Fonticula alba]|uniref:C2 domain-containing protein n=1 Tax=Fonticula alba TaxID=691883 RepID=A0A058Z9Y1_FONAL|nr:hypothetical protein H696_02674 [Fonticula alba]KCV70347.1 hypothetical protein H696_02674 [Fonticula alba]|eukprot:XP_009494863.1 hypothetical protein H696_02674 [Fonticula alba]
MYFLDLTVVEIQDLPYKQESFFRSSYPDCYVKLSLDNKTQRFTTNICRHTTSPAWDETFQFHLSADHTVSLKVCTRSSIGPERCIGFASLSMRYLLNLHGDPRTTPGCVPVQLSHHRPAGGPGARLGEDTPRARFLPHNATT